MGQEMYGQAAFDIFRQHLVSIKLFVELLKMRAFRHISFGGLEGGNDQMTVCIVSVLVLSRPSTRWPSDCGKRNFKSNYGFKGPPVIGASSIEQGNVVRATVGPFQQPHSCCQQVSGATGRLTSTQEDTRCLQPARDCRRQGPSP